MFSYVAYGLGIRSTLSLPELVVSEARADVVVRLGNVDCVQLGADAEEGCVRATAEEAYLFWEEVGTFLVRGGREITFDPAPGMEERVLRFCILGPALGVLLHQRGLLVLHASAVAVDSDAVAFLGGPGEGKSTLAAALHVRGHAVVADDVTAVQIDTCGPMVFPSFPHINLCGDAAAALGYSPEALPRLDPCLEKHALCVARGFSQHPLPLRRIYVLAEGSRQEIEVLRPQEAFVELLGHSYCARLLQATGSSSHFLQCASVTKNVPICRLKSRRSVAALPELTRLVEEDLARNISQDPGGRDTA